MDMNKEEGYLLVNLLQLNLNHSPYGLITTRQMAMIEDFVVKEKIIEVHCEMQKIQV